MHTKHELVSWINRIRKYTKPEELGFWAHNIALYDQKYFKSSLTLEECIIDLTVNNGHYSNIGSLASARHSIVLAYLDYAAENNFLYKGFQESELFKPIFNVPEYEEVGGGLNGDLCRRVCHLELMKKYFCKSVDIIFELGGGHGSLARVLKASLNVKTYIICDIPESLFFSAGFLTINFPNANFAFVDEENYKSVAANVKDYDFIFVPTGLESVFSETKIDIFINTHSLGEMLNHVIDRWAKFVNNSSIKRVFFVNRFLNYGSHIHKQNGNNCSIMLDHSWEIKHWRLNPDFMTTPFEGDHEPQYLLIMAEKGQEIESVDRRLKYVDQLCKDICLEPWYERMCAATSLQTTITDSRTVIPNRNYATHMGSTLFKLWNCLRLHPTKEGIKLFLMYLKYINFNGPIFEESLTIGAMFQRMEE